MSRSKFTDYYYGPERIGTEDGMIDPAELPEIYRALQDAEARGDVSEANRLESLIEEWVDSLPETEET